MYIYRYINIFLKNIHTYIYIIIYVYIYIIFVNNHLSIYVYNTYIHMYPCVCVSCTGPYGSPLPANVCGPEMDEQLHYTAFTHHTTVLYKHQPKHIQITAPRSIASGPTSMIPFQRLAVQAPMTTLTCFPRQKSEDIRATVIGDPSTIPREVNGTRSGSKWSPWNNLLGIGPCPGGEEHLNTCRWTQWDSKTVQWGLALIQTAPIWSFWMPHSTRSYHVAKHVINVLNNKRG